MTDNFMWVFGYGSLIWQPGFEPAARRLARLGGWHRSFCMRSIHHRGTVDAPGLVLALDPHPSAACQGMAFRVDPTAHDETMTALRERELISSAYVEERHEVHLSDDRRVTAVTYVIDTAHDQYCGGLPLGEQAEIIACAVGGRGPNRDYLFNTADHLVELGIEDAELSWLARVVRAMEG